MKTDIETIRRREAAYGGPRRPSTKEEMEANTKARRDAERTRREAAYGFVLLMRRTA